MSPSTFEINCKFKNPKDHKIMHEVFTVVSVLLIVLSIKCTRANPGQVLGGWGPKYKPIFPGEIQIGGGVCVVFVKFIMLNLKIRDGTGCLRTLA